MARNASAGALSRVTYGTIGEITGAPIAKAKRDTIATGIERAAKSAKDLNMRLGIEPCNRYVTHLVKYGPTVGCVDGTHW